jgi:hypothetical protein
LIHRAPRIARLPPEPARSGKALLRDAAPPLACRCAEAIGRWGVSIRSVLDRRHNGSALFGGAMMVGMITERDLEQADQAFPGILRFFESLSRKPRTFLQLVALFQRWCEPEERFRNAA